MFSPAEVTNCLYIHLNYACAINFEQTWNSLNHAATEMTCMNLASFTGTESQRETFWHLVWSSNLPSDPAPLSRSLSKLLLLPLPTSQAAAPHPRWQQHLARCRYTYWHLVTSLEGFLKQDPFSSHPCYSSVGSCLVLWLSAQRELDFFSSCRSLRLIFFKTRYLK